MTTLTMRPYAGESDLLPITELLNYCDAVDRLDDNYAVEDLRLEFADPRLDSARDLRLWEDADGQLVGFGQIWLPPAGEQTLDAGLYWRVHPAARHGGVEDEILDWGAERAREVARERGVAARLRSGVRDGYDYGRDVLVRHGMVQVRYFFQMKRPLDQPIDEARLPEGFALRHVAGEADVRAWVEAYNLSFVDHWGHHERTVEGHAHWLTHPSYNQERDLIAVAPDGTIAAFCFCMVDPADNARNGRNEGWIGILGTRRGYRKIGLGRAMLLAGLHRLKAEGVDTAKLNVDADNPTGALRLYESAGFAVEQSWTTYSLDL